MNNNFQSPTEAQQRYWQFMIELTTHIYYLQTYLFYYQNIERKIKYFLAIVSSSAIASWAIWKELNFIWAILIALSQVINAIKHLLPFAQREKLIRTILPELNIVSSEVELEYYKVANGIISDQDIHNKTIEFKRKKSNIIVKLDENVLPERNKFMEEAEEKTKIYFNGYYGG